MFSVKCGLKFINELPALNFQSLPICTSYLPPARSKFMLLCLLLQNDT